MNEIASHRLEELKAGGMLPSPSGAAQKVLELTARPNASIRAIASFVQRDPAMAGRILRYANAGHHNLRPVVSVPQAITFLGLFRVRQIVLGFSLIDQYRTGVCSAFDYAGYWTSSLASGIAARRLASLAHSPPDESFSCGLLAGIGRLAFATAFPEEYAAVLSKGLSGEALAKEERAQFGIDSAHLSAEMLESWGLPEVFTVAVRDHEQPAATSSAPGTRAHALCATLHFAAKIGNLLNLDEAQRWKQVPSLFNAAAKLGIEESEVPPLVDEIVADWQDWARQFELPMRTYSDLRSLLAAPPAGSAEGAGPNPGLALLRVALIVNDHERLESLIRALTGLGLRVIRWSGPTEAQGILQDDLPDLAIVDTGGVEDDAVAQVHRLRSATRNALYIIALIPAAAEARFSQLMRAGAADYLPYDFTETAIIVRLSNAQRVVALQVAVRAERELAVTSSSEWARSNRRLLKDALTDVLTKLPNRRYGVDRFAQEWSIASSNTRPISCLMLDIDHFKRVNDAHGHDVGDIVLQQVAAMIEKCCRGSDIVFRYGGEEFCVICPGAALNEAIQLGERIAAAVRDGRYGVDENKFAVTLSIGIAVRMQNMHEPDELFRAADQALLAAKEGGRNRVYTAKPKGAYILSDSKARSDATPALIV